MSVNNTESGYGFLRRNAPQTFVFVAIFLALCLSIISTDFRHPEQKSVKIQTSKEFTGIAHTSSRPFLDDIAVSGSRPDVLIEVNIPATEMTLYKDGEELFRRPVAIGSAVYPTPEQESSIHVIEWNPWWFPPDAAWARKDKPTPPGPGNPLGPVKLRLGRYGEILFHGTNKSWTVGRPTSHGCMRMFNRDAKSLAWYLQSNFSRKNDPELLEMYEKRRRSTFRVKLEEPVPVTLIYNPVVFRNNKLVFYPDHYKKFRDRRKAAIITELIQNGVDMDMLDDEKIDRLTENWPNRHSEVPISDLLTDSPVPDLLSAPECS